METINFKSMTFENPGLCNLEKKMRWKLDFLIRQELVSVHILLRQFMANNIAEPSEVVRVNEVKGANYTLEKTKKALIPE